MKRWIPLLLTLLCGLPAWGQGEDPHARVRGVTISCQTWGWEWGSDDMVVALREIKALGANWVAIHPYARIGNDGTVGSRRLSAGGGETPKWLARPIAEAQRLGLKILIKPHLAYWGSRFGWRGEIGFSDPAAWERFFSSYERWVVGLARRCKDADAFCVGTELGRTLGHEARWRAIVAAVRAETPAVLTYAANWDDYRQVGFWDTLDTIGIQAYFPLVAHERPPAQGELARSWERILGELTRYAEARNRKVVFTELGYDRSPAAARRPWESGRRGHRQGGEAGAELQRRCLETALEAIREHETVMGALLWKWFAGDARGEDFLLSEPGVRRVIRGVWGSSRQR